MRTVAIIQARMGSTRLPGKVLEEIEGKTMLARVVERVRWAREVDEVLVATTPSPADETIVRECEGLAVAVFRGSEEDVLDRYYRAACTREADPIVRITADCPLADPQIIDRVVKAFQDNPSDYASNILERTFPRGLDVEVMRFQTLKEAWERAAAPYQRSHATSYIYEHADQFRLFSFKAEADYSFQRWTVDTHEDLSFVRKIYQSFDGPAKDHFGWREVIALLDEKPELLEWNRGVRQKALHEG